MIGLLSRSGKPLPPDLRERAGFSSQGSQDSTFALNPTLPPHRSFVPEGGEHDPESFLFSVWARVDNRKELLGELGVPGQIREKICDTELVRLAYGHFGERCCEEIYGDWVLAAYHPREKRLFLARDHFGNTALYYAFDNEFFAFSTSKRNLLDLECFPVRLDELFLAQVLVSWPANHGERTVHEPIRRVPPAHLLRVTPQGIEAHLYWRLEETPILNLPRREDYVGPFREVFDEAVRTRLRIEGEEIREGAIASTLSGGLDSGSVSATAALFLKERGIKLSTYTSVPLWDTKSYVGKRFGDEFPYAAQAALFSGNMEHIPVEARDLTPVKAIRRMLEIMDEPGHAAGNLYWMMALARRAKERGGRVILTGQLGNAGISWTGDPFSQSLFFQITHYGWRRWTKERLLRLLPRNGVTALRRFRTRGTDFSAHSAIHPDFARRLRLWDLRREDPEEYLPCSSLEMRWRILKPGKSFIGSIYAAKREAGDPEYRDPTGDPRVLAFCLSVPDWVSWDPETGLDRWLIREAMKGRLPDEVRLNTNRGRQAGDLVLRLRASAPEVEGALEEIGRGQASEYVSLSHMRRVWELIQRQDNPEAFNKAITVLTRGMMAGLFVNSFFERHPQGGKGT